MNRSGPIATTYVAANRDHYKVLEVDYDASDEDTRLNYRRLALKWLLDKHKGDGTLTTKFQEINEAHRGNFFAILVSKYNYDFTGIYEIDKYTLGEYLRRFKGMILTCNELGISPSSIWAHQLKESSNHGMVDTFVAE
ncbi:hypothetical protein UlMin_041867 [Ulmus minor]